MFGIGGTELFIIVFFGLLIFGPDKLPQLGRTIGKFTKEFKRAQDQVTAQIQAEMSGIEDVMDPFAEKKESSDAGPLDKPVSQSDVDWDEEDEEE